MNVWGGGGDCSGRPGERCTDLVQTADEEELFALLFLTLGRISVGIRALCASKGRNGATCTALNVRGPSADTTH